MEFKHTKLPIELELPKLVRDNIPQIIREADGVEPNIEIAEDDSVFQRYLLKKIVEEAVEMSQEADNKVELKKEMADVIELLHKLAELENFDLSEIDTIREEKSKKNGSFDKRYILVSR